MKQYYQDDYVTLYQGDCIETMRSMSNELDQHHRIDPMTSRDRCICGYRAELGKSFNDHIARAIVAQPEVNSVKASAWDEGFQAGWSEAKDPGAFVNDVWDAKTPNPYNKENNE